MHNDSLQLLLIHLRNSSTVSTILPSTPGAGLGAARYALWTFAPPTSDPAADSTSHRTPDLAPFSERATLNSVMLPQTVDTIENATGFLGAIPVDPVRGEVAAGIELPPLSVSFVCYSSAGLPQTSQHRLHSEVAAPRGTGRVDGSGRAR
uniref:Uncharacterized protein n=1 Tax=Haptolina ericina TaxID=156174 RepID=A0A7S3AFM4_9EUKA